MKSIFKGKHIKIEYKFDQYSSWNQYPYISKESKVTSYETILETELDTPPLEAGDQFYLVKEDKIVYIEKALRGTDNVMVYFTDMILSTEEELEESLKQAVKEREEYLIRKKEADEKYEQERKARNYKDEYENSFFLKRIFMRKPNKNRI